MGIPVPPDVRTALERGLAQAAPQLGALRRTDPSGWHVTLAFVGPLADEHLSALHAAVTEAVRASGGPDASQALPAELRIASAGRFASQVLFYGVADGPDGSVAPLGAAIQSAIARAGLPVERRAVRPHVTVARGSRAARVDDRIVAALDATVPAGSLVRWTPGAVALYRAVDRDGPARYEIEASVPLSAG